MQKLLHNTRISILCICRRKKFLIKDGILSKAWDIIAFIDSHTAWGKETEERPRNKRASIVTKDEFGNEIESGFKSEIQGVTLKNDPQLYVVNVVN